MLTPCTVTGTVNSSAQVINTYRYKPFGDLLSKTGTGADPAFGWVGTQGYKQTQKKFSNFYVRARHYGSAQGRWTTVDPLIYNELLVVPSFEYVKSNPVLLIDPTGLVEYYTGRATCFSDKGLFCNSGHPEKGYPHGFKHGMTAAWPNVCYICGKDNCYQRRCDETGGAAKPVKCGD